YCSKARFEPAAATVLVTDDRIDCWLGTQAPEAMLQTAAKMSGVAPSNVYIHLTFMGGGYGSDQGALPSQAVAVAMAMKGRPVQTRATRDEDWSVGTRFRPAAIASMKAGVDAQGYPIAIEVRGAGSWSGDQLVRGMTAPPYYMPHYKYSARELEEFVPLATRRATGASSNSFFLESFIDELAHAAGKDPFQYRRELIARNPAGKPGV